MYEIPVLIFQDFAVSLSDNPMDFFIYIEKEDILMTLETIVHLLEESLFRENRSASEINSTIRNILQR